MQVVDANGNMYGDDNLEINDINGKLKTTGGGGITALNSLTGAAQTFGNDTNVTMVSSGTNHAITWAGTLADSRIASASTWNAKQNALVSGTNIKTVNGNSLVGSGNVTIGPKLLGYSGILGTPTTLNIVTICHSLLIPANTFNSNNILQLVFRMHRQSGNLGQMYGRIYSNTTNTLTGATLISNIYTMNGGGTAYLGYCERNYSYDGTSLRTMVGATQSEYTVGAIQTTTFNRTSNQYILFTMQCQNVTDVANVDLFKVFAYV